MRGDGLKEGLRVVEYPERAIIGGGQEVSVVTMSFTVGAQRQKTLTLEAGMIRKRPSLREEL